MGIAFSADNKGGRETFRSAKFLNIPRSRTTKVVFENHVYDQTGPENQDEK
jgi:hypothetical protein